MKKNILIILENYPAYGGVERVTTLLANYLCEQGYSISIAATNHHSNEDLLDLLNTNVRCFHLPYKQKTNSKINREYLDKFIFDNGISMIINQGLSYQLTLLSLSVAKTNSCKYISVLHNSPDAFIIASSASRSASSGLMTRGLKQSAKFIFWKYYITYVKLKIRRFYKKIYNESDKVVLLSSAFAESFANIANITSFDKIVSIPNPLTFSDITCFHDLKKEKTILYVGRFDKVQKRVDRAVNIFLSLHKKFPDWQLILVGEGDQLSELQQLSNGNASIHFTGSLTDPREHYRRSSILILTSEFEGFGMVLTEALQFGVVPVAYASYSSIFDIIKDGVNGFAVEPFNQDLFIGRLEELMGNADMLTTMSATALKSSNKFRQENILPQWVSLLEGMKV